MGKVMGEGEGESDTIMRQGTCIDCEMARFGGWHGNVMVAWQCNGGMAIMVAWQQCNAGIAMIDWSARVGGLVLWVILF